MTREPLTPEERELAGRLARLGAPAGPSSALDARILAAAHAAAEGRGSRARRPRWPVALGIAATLVLAIGIAWQLRPAQDSTQVWSEAPVAARGSGPSAADELPVAAVAEQASPTEPPPPPAESAATPREPELPQAGAEAGTAQRKAPVAFPGAVGRAPAEHRHAPRADPPEGEDPQQDPARLRAKTAPAPIAQEQPSQEQPSQEQSQARQAPLQAGTAQDAVRQDVPAPSSSPRPAAPPPPPPPAEVVFDVPAPAPVPAVAGSRDAAANAAVAAPVDTRRQESAARVQPARKQAATTLDRIETTAAPAPERDNAGFTDEALDDQPPATADSPDVQRAWLQRIRELLADGDTDGARASLAEFKRRYPRYALPEDLREFAPPPSPPPSP